MDGAQVLVPILVPISLFAMVFGLVYLKSRENLSMIEKGMNPKEFANRPAPYRNLKNGLLLLGAGIGLALAYFITPWPHQFIQDRKERAFGQQERLKKGNAII
jgi:amino acid transporter